jgi:hypothetical protein
MKQQVVCLIFYDKKCIVHGKYEIGKLHYFSKSGDV